MMDRNTKVRGKKRFRAIVPGFVLCLSLGAMVLLYSFLALDTKASFKTEDLVFEGSFFLLMLVCAFIVLPQRRKIGTVCVGLTLLVFGSFSDVLDEFFKLPSLVPRFIEGLLLTVGAFVTAIGLWRWIKQTSDQAAGYRGLLEKERSQRHELEALVKINSCIAGLLADRDILLDSIAERGQKLLGVDAVGIRAVKVGSIAGVAYAGKKNFVALKTVTTEVGTFNGDLTSEHPVILTRNVSTDARIEATYRELLTQAGARSFFCAPLRVGDRLIGTMEGMTEDERIFPPQELEMIKAFADQAAMAIANADLLLEIKENVAELEKLNRNRQRADEVKSEFVSAMSYEVRTPLNVIVGYGGLLMERLGSGVSGVDTRAFNAVHEQSQVLSKVVTEVLQMAKMDAGDITLDATTFPLEELVLELRTFVDGLHRHPGLEILWDIDDNLPVVCTDRLKLRRVLENLIGNAFKFTTEGRVAIGIQNLESADRMVFSVSDTGVGIPKADLSRVFDAFYRGKAMRGDGSNGVGLGLSLAKKYVELMEGEMQLESEWGVGTTFTATLPRVSADIRLVPKSACAGE